MGNGTSGNSTGVLNGPWDVSVDSGSNLYVSDGYSNRIIKFSSGSAVGIPLTSGMGNGLSQVQNPSASVIDNYGNLYVSDMFNHRIMEYANISVTSISRPISGQVVAGGSLDYSYSGIGISWGVAVDDHGNVFVSDYSYHRVMKWQPGSSSGVLVAGNGTSGNDTSQLSCPLGIFLDQNVALYIADACNDRIQKWLIGSSAGITVAGDNGQIGFPTDVSVDTYGTIYAWSGGGLYRFYPGSTWGTVVISSYSSVFGFKFDSIGNVYAADYSSNMISKYTLNSTSCGMYILYKSYALSKLRNIFIVGGKIETIVSVSAKDLSASNQGKRNRLLPLC